MNKITLLIFFLIIFSGLKAQQLPYKEQQIAQKTVINMFEALSMRDAVRLKTYCTTAITFYEYGEIWDLDTLISKAITQNTATDFKRSNTFEFINTKIDKNTAWLTYELTSVITKDGKVVTKQWLETVILAKQKKQWKVNHLHSTLINKT